jgi:hypothetical protein
VDPNDGRSYDQAAFLAEYGGLAEWDAAVRHTAPTELYRVDPKDGFAYTETDFVVQYGGLAEWEAAAVATTSTRKKPSLNALLAQDKTSAGGGGGNGGGGGSGGKAEARVDPSDGYAYTKEDFVSQYGGTAEWDGAELVPRGCGSYTKPLLDELRGKMVSRGARWEARLLETNLLTRYAHEAANEATRY